MLFRNLCKQPAMFETIDMTLPNGFSDKDLPYDLNVMTEFAVDRSCGCLVDIYLEILCDDDTLIYIIERSKNLKRLRLGHHIGVSDKGLAEAIKTLPMLEELELIMCCFYDGTVEAVGRACPSLKSLSLNDVWSKDRECNDEAMAIARCMHNLRSLQLIGNFMTNEGLEAILDGCPLLESLDLRACFHINLSGDLGKRCEQLKHFLHPNASTADYGHQACKCNANDTHLPCSGRLICWNGPNGESGSLYYPNWDDDLEYIDYEHLDEDAEFRYDANF